MFEQIKYPLDAKYGNLDNEVIFTKEPRHGFWSVSFKRGDVPAILKGKWTSLAKLQRVTQNYLETRRDNKATLGDKIEEDSVGVEDRKETRRKAG